MPVRYSNLQRKSRTCPITVEDVNGERTNIMVTYDPSKYSSDAYFDLTSGDQVAIGKFYREHLPNMITSWDLVDDGDQPILPTPEFIRGMEQSLLDAIAEGILADLRPNK